MDVGNVLYVGSDELVVLFSVFDEGFVRDKSQDGVVKASEGRNYEINVTQGVTCEVTLRISFKAFDQARVLHEESNLH